MLLDTVLDPRQRLKQATAPAHASLEDLIGSLDDHRAYARYARGMHAFRSAVEQWLSGGATYEGAWRPKTLSRELADDLADIGARPLGEPIAFSPCPRTDAFALGVHYVLEGSALGARIVCKQVEALGLSRDHGARHLWAQAASLEPWRAFLALLQRRGADDFEELAAGANAAFAAASVAMRKAAHG